MLFLGLVHVTCYAHNKICWTEEVYIPIHSFKAQLPLSIFSSSSSSGSWASWRMRFLIPLPQVTVQLPHWLQRPNDSSAEMKCINW